MMVQEELFSMLRNGVVTVEFNKVNGDYRKMRCSLNDEYLPEGYTLPEFEDSITRFSVIDIDKNEWRSFRLDSILSYEVTNNV